MDTLLVYFQSLSPLDTALLFSTLFGTILLYLLTSYLLWKFEDKIKSKVISALVYSVEAILILIYGFFAHEYAINHIVKSLILEYSIFFAIFTTTSFIFNFVNVSTKLKIFVYLLLILAILIDVSLTFIKDKRITFFLLPAFKLITSLSAFLIFFAVSKLIKHGHSRKFFRILLLILFFFFTYMWLTNKVRLGFISLIGLTLLVSLNFLYLWLSSNLESILDKYLKRFNLSREDIHEISRFTEKIFLFLLVYSYYYVIKTFLDLEKYIRTLKKSYVIETELLKISLFNLFVSIYAFFFIYYTVNALKKTIKIIFPEEERELKSGTLEALIYNLGTFVAFLVALSSLGFTWKGLLPIAGALGVGVGFGLQTIFNNYISGFILAFSRKIKIGDFIEISGNAGRFLNNKSEVIFGKVADMSILSTKVITLDGVEVLIPNSHLIQNQIINYTFTNPYVRFRFTFAVSYSSDPEKVKEILLELAKECPFAKNTYRPPRVSFVGMEDSALIFELRIWVDIREVFHAPFDPSDWIYTNGFYKLKKAGIEIPFPQRDLWFRNDLRVIVEKKQDKDTEEKPTQEEDSN